LITAVRQQNRRKVKFLQETWLAKYFSVVQ